MIVTMAIPVLILMLQVFLSKKENKWLGLILPTLCFIGSVVSVAGMVSFNSLTTEKVVTVTEGVQATENIIQSMTSGVAAGTSSMALEAVAVFVVSNIPTILFLIIYIGCRNKLRKRRELEKMAIQDL